VVDKVWRVVPVDPAVRDRLAGELRVSPILAALLLSRGIGDAGEAGRFLDPRLAHLHDPLLLPDMERAAERIERAVGGGESIAVCGDYDVDGLSATALLVEFFRLLGKTVRTHVPDRLSEGYGLGRAAVSRLADEGVDLIITVDNGSSAVEAISLAASRGIDVVVADHHQPPEVPPPALALVNPWAPGSRYPFPYLAGVGVAFKLVWAISQRFSRSKKLSQPLRDFLLDSLALAALGTISDVVPLCGENRVLAKYGLRRLEETKSPGLRQLVEYAKRGRVEPLLAEHVAFRIGPAINAVGRLGNAGEALRLLTTSSEEEARRLVTVLDRENRRRRQIEAEIHADVRRRVEAEVDLELDRAIVLADPKWHPGVIGIVAARVVEEFCRPTLLIALDGGQGRGSARSIANVHICEALQRCSAHLIAFGGHAHAAGVEVAAGSVDALQRALNDAIPIPPSEMVPALEIEAEVGLPDLSPALLAELSRLEPFGSGNRPPLFAVRGLEVAGTPRIMGQDGAHLSFFVRSAFPPRSPRGDGESREPSPQAALKAVAFGRAHLSPTLSSQGRRFDLAFRPMINRWGGSERIELDVKEIRTS
jgi:single-stranded-DNA-specific exonuclease